MLSDLRSWFDRRSGYQFAQKVLEAFEDGIVRENEIRDGVRNAFAKKHRHFQSEFSRGWDRRWLEMGAEDARQGRCRSNLFRTRYYDIGWTEQIAERSRYGWRNPSLEAQQQTLWSSNQRDDAHHHSSSSMSQ